LGDGSGEGEPSDQSGQRHTGGHVVVDADHVRAQTRIDRYLIRAIAGLGGRDIPVEVRHREYPWVIPAPAGLCARKAERRCGTNLVRKASLRQMERMRYFG